MGHWGKLKFGKPVKTTSLPEWEGEETLITLVSKKSQKPSPGVRTVGTDGIEGLRSMIVDFKNEVVRMSQIKK